MLLHINVSQLQIYLTSLNIGEDTSLLSLEQNTQDVTSTESFDTEPLIEFADEVYAACGYTSVGCGGECVPQGSACSDPTGFQCNNGGGTCEPSGGSYFCDCSCPDDDNDGICNANDQCEGVDDALLGTACSTNPNECKEGINVCAAGSHTNNLFFDAAYASHNVLSCVDHTNMPAGTTCDGPGAGTTDGECFAGICYDQLCQDTVVTPTPTGNADVVINEPNNASIQCNQVAGNPISTFDIRVYHGWTYEETLSGISAGSSVNYSADEVEGYRFQCVPQSPSGLEWCPTNNGGVGTHGPLLDAVECFDNGDCSSGYICDANNQCIAGAVECYDVADCIDNNPSAGECGYWDCQNAGTPSSVCVNQTDSSGTACNDGLFCTDTDECDGSGTGSAACVGTGDPCTSTETCDEPNDECDINTCNAATLPGNATSCNANPPTTHNQSYSYTASCGSTACTFDCDSGYTRNGSACVIANNPPTAADNSLDGYEDVDLVFTAGDFNYSDPDSDPMNKIIIAGSPAPSGNGSLYLDSNNNGNLDQGETLFGGEDVLKSQIDVGQLRFEPLPNDHNDAYFFFYFYVHDGIESSVLNYEMEVNVLPVNDPPQGTDTVVVVDEDTTVIIGESDFGFLDPIDSPENSFTRVRIASLETNGDLELNGLDVTLGQYITTSQIDMNQLTFRPFSNEHGAGYASFTFQVEDNGGTANGGVNLDPTPNTITIDVTALDDPPTISAIGNQTTPKNTSTSTINFQIDDIDSSLTCSNTYLSMDSANELLLDDTDVVRGGSVPNCTAVLTPNSGESGVTNITFIVAADGQQDTEFFNLTVTNDAPVAVTDNVTVNEGESVSIDVLFNDFDPDGDTLNISLCDLAQPLHGSVSEVSGECVYTHDGSETITDDFTYEITDDDVTNPETDIGTVNVTITPLYNLYICENTGDRSEILDDPSCTSEDPLSVQGQGGALCRSSQPSSTYCSVCGDAEIDDDEVCDGALLGGQTCTDEGYDTGILGCSGACDAYDTSACNTYPVAGDTSAVTLEDTNYDFTTNDFDAFYFDADGDNFTGIQIAGTPGLGQLYIDYNLNDIPDGGENVFFSQELDFIDIDYLKFLPAPDASGTPYDFFYFRVYDDIDYSENAYEMTINVDSVNDEPEGSDTTIVIDEDSSYIFEVLDFGFDDFDDSPADSFNRVRISSLETNGDLELNGSDVTVGQYITVAQINSNQFTFETFPNENGAGYASFTFQVEDDGGTANGGVNLDQTPNTMTVNVDSVNDPPTISTIGNQVTPENTSLGPIPFSITDIEDTLDCTNDISITSSNTTLIPVANVTITGTEPNCQFSVTPATNEIGVSTMEFIVTDSGGLVVSEIFDVQVSNSVVCGDGNIEGVEQCDDGGTMPGDGCDGSCNLETPQCVNYNFSIVPGTGYVALSVTGSFSLVSGSTVDTLDWGTGTAVLNPNPTETFTYTEVSDYTGSITITNNLSGAYMTTCSQQISVLNIPVDGVCGVVSGASYYGQNILTGGNVDLCTTGFVNNFSGPDANGGYTWQCAGEYGGTTPTCIADEDRCSDTVINVGTYSNIGSITETCDDGGVISGDGCDASCQLEIPVCASGFNFTITPMSGVSPLLVTGTYTNMTGFIADSLYFGTGDIILNPPTSTGYTYTQTGNYTAELVLSNASSGALVTTCSIGVIVSDTAIDGTCGATTSGASWYTTAGNPILTGGSVGLCDAGTLTGFTGPDAQGNYARGCDGVAGGLSVSCAADEDRCGDALINTGDYTNVSGVAEECDDTNQNNGDGCSSACYIEAPICANFNFAITPASGYVTLNVTGTFTNMTGFTVDTLDRGTGIAITNPNTTETFTYTEVGNYTGVLTVSNIYSGSATTTCTESVTVNNNIINGACGIADGSMYYGENNLSGGSVGLCDMGILSGLVGPTPTTGNYSRSCIGQNGGTTDSCSAEEDRCSDGAVNTGVYTNIINVNETCDDGNTTSGDGCDALCVLETPYCDLSLDTSQITLGDTVTASETSGASQSWIDYTILDRGDLTSGTIVSFPSGHTYTDIGLYTVQLDVASNISGSLTNICIDTVEVYANMDCADLDLRIETTFPNGRTQPLLDEEFDMGRNTVLPTGVSLASIDLAGTSLSTGAGLYTTGFSATGTYILTGTLSNGFETQTCTLAFAVQDYQFDKIYNVNNCYEQGGETYCTYQVDAYVPAGFTGGVTITDYFLVSSGGSYTGVASMVTGSIAIVETGYTITNGPNVTIEDVVPFGDVNRGFDITVSGAVGPFTLTYDALILQEGDGICNFCEIQALQGTGSIPTLWNNAYAQSDYATTTACGTSFTPTDTCGPVPAGCTSTCGGNDSPLSGGGLDQGRNVVTSCSTPGTTNCECLQTNPICDTATLPSPAASYNICNGTANPGGPLSQAYSDVGICTGSDPFCSYELIPYCDPATSIVNTVDCVAPDWNPPTSTGGVVYSLSGDCVSNTNECNVICDAGYIYNVGAGTCDPAACDYTTIPTTGDAGYITGASAITCAENPASVGDPFAEWVGTPASCTGQPGCRYYRECDAFGEQVSPGGVCERVTEIEKTGVLSGSRIFYTIDISLSDLGGVGAIRTFRLDDILTPVNGDTFSGFISQTLSGISLVGGSLPSISGTSSYTFDLIEDTAGEGGTAQFVVEVIAVEGGDDELCNDVDITDLVNVTDTAHDQSCVAGYSFDIQKTFEPAYDTNEGIPGFNTYPPNLNQVPTYIYDGDWLVYTVDVTMIGDGDALDGDIMDPVITDTPDASLEILDFIGAQSGIDGDGRPRDVVISGSPGAQQLVYSAEGKFLLGETITFSFIAKFTDSGNTQVCNDVAVVGENPATLQGPNTDQSCIDLGTCGIRSCVGEIYGTDFATGIVGNTITMTGACIIEGTCDMADRIDVLAHLTYTSGRTGLVASDGSIDLPSRTECGTTQPVILTDTGSVAVVTSSITDVLSGWNADFTYYDLSTIQVVDLGGTYEVRFDYRCGDPFLTCEKQTCVGSGDTLSKQWLIDTPTFWQDIDDIDTNPFDTTNGTETLSGTCDTCTGTGVNPTGDMCPYDILPNGECGLCPTCRSICCPAGATGHLVGEWVEYLGTGFVFEETAPPYCELPGGGTSPAGAGIDTDGDGNVDVCVDCTVDSDCSDNGLYCDGAEYCDLTSNTCVSDGVNGCDDADICTDDICNESTDSCQNLFDAGNDISCAFTGPNPTCGDGVIDTGEVCGEPGLSCGAGEVCTNCGCVTNPLCASFDLVVTPTLGAVPMLVTGTFTNVTGYTVNGLDRGDGTLTDPVSSPSLHTYTIADTFNVSLHITQNATSTDLICYHDEIVDTSANPNNGLCNPSYDGQIIYDPANDGTALTAMPSLCAVGTVTGFDYDGTRWIWYCAGIGDTDTCSATPGWCGDGVVGGALGYAGSESCDYGSINGDTGVACDVSCQCAPGYEICGGDLCVIEDSCSFCGDGEVNPINGFGELEVCDQGDANGNPGSTCNSICQCATGLVSCNGECVLPGLCFDRDLIINKNVINEQPYYLSGDIVRYEVVFSNSGDYYTGQQVRVTDILPDGFVLFGNMVTVGSGDVMNSPGGGASTLVWEIDNFSPGASMTIQYDVLITDSRMRPWINTVTIEDPDGPIEEIPPGTGTCTQTGVNPFNGPTSYAEPGTNNTDCEEIYPVYWDLIINKQVVGGVNHQVGETVDYIITFANSGGVITGNNVIITDRLPLDTVFTGTYTSSVGVSAGPVAGETGTITWTMPTLPPGETGTITYSIYLAGDSSLPRRNIVTIEDPDAPELEDILAGSGVCDQVGGNPFDGPSGYAEAGTNNTDCEEIAPCFDATHCTGDGAVCIDNTCVNNSVCTYFDVAPTSAFPPATSSYVCSGSGTTYNVQATRNGVSTYTNNISAGTIPFVTTGVYEVSCAIDNDTGMRCDGDVPVDIAQLDSLFTRYISDLEPLVMSGSADCTNGWMSELQENLDYSFYINTSQDAFASQLIADTNQTLLIHSISQSCSFYTPSFPEQSLTQQIDTQANNLVTTTCYESCVVPTYIGTGDMQTCNTLSTDSSLQRRAPVHTVEFTCTAATGFTGYMMELGCDDLMTGETIYRGLPQDLGDGTRGLSGSCTYYRGANQTASFYPSCSVAGFTTDTCNQAVTLTKGTGGPNYCGDGNRRPESGEECDDGNAIDGDGCSSNCKKEGGEEPPSPVCGDGVKDIGEECDDGNTIDDDDCSNRCTTGGDDDDNDDEGFGDPSCYRPDEDALVTPVHCVADDGGEQPMCAWIDPPSIELGEYLPFWRDVEFNDAIDQTAISCADLSARTTIPGGSMICNFSITNGSQKEWKLDGIPCFEDTWRSVGGSLYRLFDTPYFEEYTQYARGRSYIKLVDVLKGDEDDALAVGDRLGEYQISLDSIDYTTCTSTGPQDQEYIRTSGERICSMNFSVTDGFYMYKGPVLYSETNMNLERYTDLSGTPIISQELVDRISGAKATSYTNSSVQELTEELIDAYVDAAVGTHSLASEHVLYSLEIKNDTLMYTSVFLRKVPNQEVYIYDGIQPLVIAPSQANDTPFTLLATQANIIVQGSLSSHALIVAPAGTIFFENLDCGVTDVVEGLFIAGKGFASSTIENTELGQSWCDAGNLRVVGSLLSPVSFEKTLSQHRRSVISDWFNISSSTQEEKIFDAASVLFEADPSTRSFTPPGIDLIDKSLRIAK